MEIVVQKQKKARIGRALEKAQRPCDSYLILSTAHKHCYTNWQRGYPSRKLTGKRWRFEQQAFDFDHIKRFWEKMGRLNGNHYASHSHQSYHKISPFHRHCRTSLTKKMTRENGQN